jgi:hypothetical protein
MLMQVKPSSQSLELPQELLHRSQALDQSASQAQEQFNDFPIRQQAQAQSPSMVLQLQIFTLQLRLQVRSLLQLLDMATSAAQQSSIAIELAQLLSKESESGLQ